MRSPQEFGEDPRRLPVLRKANEASIRPLCNAGVDGPEGEHADVETLGIESADNFASVAHLRIGKACVCETVHENANRLHPEITETKANFLPRLVNGNVRRMCPF